ncbi:MAG: CheR family methyltransferase [Bacteroidota bacterium]
MNRLIIGISELKSLILTIKTKKGVDFSNYALSSLKRRVESFMLRFHFQNIEEVIHKISNDEKFYELFLKDILVSSTELFRDPEFWRELKVYVLNKFKFTEEIKILIPECNSGEELYTLLIILDQINMLDRVKILSTSLSHLNVEEIKNATIEFKKMEVNSANFERFHENGNIFDFFIKKGSVVKFNTDLFKNVEIIHHNLFEDELPGVYNFILYRNKTIYYNQQLKTEALKKLGSSLKIGGFMAVGIKETIEFPGVDREFVVISESEKIFKKSN